MPFLWRLLFSHVEADGTLGEPTVQGTIPPHTQKEFGMVFLGPDYVKRVEAKDTSGNVVFTHDYKLDDMKTIGWKITVPQ